MKIIHPNRIVIAMGYCLVMGGVTASVHGSNCAGTSVGLTPIDDLGAGLYLGQFSGGLYPNGSNLVPAAHAAEGLIRAQQRIGPMDINGLPDPAGKVVLLSVGMSNTTQEFCSANSFQPCDPWTFMGRAATHSSVNHTTLAIVNGARGGQAATSWDSPADPNYDRVLNDQLTPRGLSEAQVRVLWIKQANPGPTVSLPAANADAFALEASLGDIVRAAKTRYPNLEIAFFSSRIYAGYASTPLNPEPYAYESGFSVKWLIEAQINQAAGGPIDPVAGDLDLNTVAPWLAWGPYLWADGLTPRSDGLVWECSDMENDGTHPAMPAESRVGAMLLEFMLTSPFSRSWFTACGSGDPNNDGVLNGQDVAIFVNVLLGQDTDPGHVLASDINCDGAADGDDIRVFIDLIIP